MAMPHDTMPGAVSPTEDESPGVTSPTNDSTSPTSKEQALANLHRAPINPGAHAHRCKYCPSTFAKTEHLKRHERSHTKERPYVCGICGKKFTRGDSLTRHLRLHENGGVVMDGDPEEEDVVKVEEGKGKGKRGKASAESPTQRAVTVRLTPRVVAELNLAQSGPVKAEHSRSRSPRDEGFALDPQLAGQEPTYKKRRISPTAYPSETPRYEDFLAPNAPGMTPGYRSIHTSLSLSDLYANPPHGESVRSTYQHDWSSRSQTGERDEGDERDSLGERTRSIKASEGSGGSFSNPTLRNDMQDLNAYTSPQTLLVNSMGYAQHDMTGGPSSGFPASTHDRLKAEVQQEIGIANSEGVFAQSNPRNGQPHAGPSDFYDGTGLAPTGFEGMDFSSFGGFDFNSSPTHLDLLQLLATDGSLAFGHTLIPQFHTYTRRNSPVLETGESAFPGTQLARHPHMEIDVNAWNDLREGKAEPSNPAGEVDLSQLGVSMDIAQFWSGMMGHAPAAPHPDFGGVPPEGNYAQQMPVPQPSADPPQATEKSKQDAGKRSASMETPFSLGASGRPQEAINEARCLITDLSFNLNASTSPLSAGFLDLCLTTFFTRFLTTFNVIHRPTFSVRQAPGPLLINMIALGSLYVPAPDAKEKVSAGEDTRTQLTLRRAKRYGGSCTRESLRA